MNLALEKVNINTSTIFLLDAVGDLDQGPIHLRARAVTTAGLNREAAAALGKDAAHLHLEIDATLTDKDLALHPGQSPGHHQSLGQSPVRGLDPAPCLVRDHGRRTKEMHHLRTRMMRTEMWNTKNRMMCK